jgi:hypothetical protein
MFKKKIIFFALIILNYQIKSTQIISLGFNCRPAAAVHSYGLRNASYPFDWIWSQFEYLYQTLEDDFKHFCEPESLYAGPDNMGVKDYYGFHFMHDFPTIQTYVSPLKDNWKDAIPAVHAKYLKRIARFKELLSGTEKIYFIRYHFITKDQAIALRDLLIKKYPNLDFTLIAVGKDPDMQKDWGLERIRNFQYVTVDNQNQADEATWTRIFQTLGIQSLPINRCVDNAFVCCGHHDHK